MSTTSTGAPASAVSASVSANGRLVVFDSPSPDIVPDDHNGREDVFLFNEGDGSIRRMSVDAEGHEGSTSDDSNGGIISNDGRYVFFESVARLVPEDLNTSLDVYVRDLTTDRLAWLDIRKSQPPPQSQPVGVGDISGDGRFVLIGTDAPDLVPDDTNDTSDLFLVDRDPDHDGVFDNEAGKISLQRVSVSSSGQQSDGSAGNGKVSDDGRFVAFLSVGTTLAPNLTCGSCPQIYVRDVQSATTSLISVDDSGSPAGGLVPVISGDGRFIAYASISGSLADGDTNQTYDVFLFDRLSGLTELISANREGEVGNAQSCLDYSSYGFEFFTPCLALSSDGRYVYFTSMASNLVVGDSNCLQDLFVRDTMSGTTTRVSVGIDGHQLNGASGGPNVSPDGRWLVFYSGSSNLLPTTERPANDMYREDVEEVNSTGYVETSGIASSSQGVDFSPPGCNSPIGDVDCNGQVDMPDAIDILKFVEQLGLRSDCMTPLGNTDCYFDYDIDVFDALAVVENVGGIIPDLPSCPPPWEHPVFK